MINVREVDTLIEVKNIAKIYPDRIRIFEYKREFLQMQKGFESQDKKPRKLKNDSEGGESLFRSKRRTKTSISDITLSNKFDIFATFTFKDDRQDVDKCKTKMSRWLNSQQKIHGKFEYLIVAEYHKDGKSIHFHALLQNYKGNLTLAKMKHNPKKLYNIKSYKLGHSTANYIKSKEKVSSYIKKYITKDMPEFAGKKRYWASRGLIRPQVIQNFDFRNNPFLQYDLVYEHKQFDIYEIRATIQVLNKRGVEWTT